MNGPPLSTQPSTHDALLRRGKWTYICGLLLIAALSVCSHLAADSIIQRQSDTARLVNLSGRQRMLSQRIVKVAVERTIARHRSRGPELQRIMRESILRMAAVHQALLEGSPDFDLKPPPPEVLAIYTGPQWKLDLKVRLFLADARILAEQPAAPIPADDPHLASLEEDARQPLLDALDAAVTAYQQFSEHSIQTLRSRLACFTALQLAILFAEALFLFRPLFDRLTHQQQYMLHIGRTDPLTGCLNRRAFDDFTATALARCRRTAEPLSLLVLDIDRFKSVNDTYGHAAGDLVLKTLVATLAHTARTSDTLFRIGGEEFAILLSDCQPAATCAVAARFLESVARTACELPHATLKITVSIGAAILHPTDLTHHDLLARADQALYQAKHAGRNRIKLSAAPLPTTPPGSLFLTPLGEEHAHC